MIHITLGGKAICVCVPYSTLEKRLAAWVRQEYINFLDTELTRERLTGLRYGNALQFLPM